MTPRPLVVADLPGLLAVQRACYGDGFIESAEVYARRLASAANCSLVIAQDGQVLAYAAAYHSLLGKVTPLHGDFEPPPAPDTLYLHDMAVHPAHAGRGLARALLAALRASARGLRHRALVSVQGSQAYWQRQGYAIHLLLDPRQQQRLAGYGKGAVYMAQSIQ
ncbi:MAG: GNAT family N-acetyltransferase [Proteobacteria bacterium]|nr:GNAT family N-acetyltransferase [Pseudomonadota bacterium]